MLEVHPLEGNPSFLSLGAWQSGEQSLEFVSRRRLDTRQVVPYFVRDGECFAGLLARERASRAARGAPLSGLEPVGIDLAGVDETGDILNYGKAIFTARAGVSIDASRLKIPLPSYARSIGYLTELGLPLLVPVEPPASASLAVSWDSISAEILFLRVPEALERLARGPWSEDLDYLLHALDGPRQQPLAAPRPGADAWAAACAGRTWSAGQLAGHIRAPSAAHGLRRAPAPRAEQLRFLRAFRADMAGVRWEFVTPGSGLSAALLPYVVASDGPRFILWFEERPAVLERRERLPLYDTPIPLSYVNATSFFLRADEAERLGGPGLRGLLEELLGRALGGGRVVQVEPLGGPAEPAPSVSSELRFRYACELDPASLGALPPGAMVMSAAELSRAAADGLIRDPVILLALARMGRAWGVDTFAAARQGSPPRRLAFLDAMTQGSIVQRRLQAYSAIEAEQLEAPTYARLMLRLQHEYGVRIAYPKSEADRSFFKAAFRVFMADHRGEDRALQGLHWSHDAYHFALGNHTLPPFEGFASWYESDAPLPEGDAPEGPAYERYVAALKGAEDEATFFSFWTLFHEKPSLRRFVKQLTFWEALRDMGITERAAARAVFDAVTVRAEIPAEISGHRLYAARDDIRGLFAYMQGFRDYHLKDIRPAYRFASRDVYRGFFLRHGIYEGDAGRYLDHVRGFQASLDATPPGLNPLRCAWADARVVHSLRVWDVVKALKLLRKASEGSAGRGPLRRGALSLAEEFMTELDGARGRLNALHEAIHDAEIVPKNEALFGEIEALGGQLEGLRGRLWDRVEGFGLLGGDQLAEERSRELPR